MRARGDVRLDQHRRVGGVARYGRDAALAQLLDELAVLLGDDERHAALVSASPMRRPTRP